MLLGAGGSAMANGDAVYTVDAAHAEVSGWVESGAFCYHRNRYKLFFSVAFDRPFTAYGTWRKQELRPNTVVAADHAESPMHIRPVSGIPEPATDSNGAQAGAYVQFATHGDTTVEARVGISFVSVDNARANLAAENFGYSHKALRESARDAWNSLLSRIDVRGGKAGRQRRDERTFYTMLYHALLGPNVASDVSGDFMGMDGAVHRTARTAHYANFSGWDSYRCQMPLVAMLAPERSADMIESLVTDARHSGWLPKWSVASGHTNVMVGDPAAPIIAGAHALGVRDFDTDAALAAMVKGATETGRSPNADYIQRAGLEDYTRLGYVPHDGTQNNDGASTSILGDPGAIWGSAATTLEYLSADFAIASFAQALGNDEIATRLFTRCAGWKKLHNPATGHLQPRMADGTFPDHFDPAGSEGFVEGSAAQYRWLVPYDIAGLSAALGGDAASCDALDRFFEHLNDGPESVHAYMGNEPTALTPWIYDWLGRPERAQETVRRILLELYDCTPAGYPGNDDIGHMSAWYVFAAIGMYPAIAGTDVLALASPLFQQIDLRLRDRRISIRAPHASRRRPFVRTLRVNGKLHARTWLKYQNLRDGASWNTIYDASRSAQRSPCKRRLRPRFPIGRNIGSAAFIAA